MTNKKDAVIEGINIKIKGKITTLSLDEARQLKSSLNDFFDSRDNHFPNMPLTPWTNPYESPWTSPPIVTFGGSNCSLNK